MPRIRIIDIQNFRAIKHLIWRPSAGINCLIGPGDSGKSTVLDAIDLCLGARRNVQFTDADFHQLNVDVPINIRITIGELDDALKTLDSYGPVLRAFHSESGVIDDEPERGAEAVLTVDLTVGSDLEPTWSLFSERAAEQHQTRTLGWGDRVRLSPTWVGALAGYNLGWRKGSVLNRLSEERADIGPALAKAARDARLAFGTEAEQRLGETLGIVSTTATELGIRAGKDARAMLDPTSVSFTGGTISLHSQSGVPLSAMGTGSVRLLIVGLQRRAAAQSSIVLLDELEHGLEPHRIIRLIGSLGAKDTPPPLQAFVTTHSPAALRELAGNQLFVLRPKEDRHECTAVGVAANIQGTIRAFPEAFLSHSPIVCEGASEVGLLRGIDLHRTRSGKVSLAAQGVSLVDGGGESKLLDRARAFLALDYRTAILRDDDTPRDRDMEAAFGGDGGRVFAWREGRALEDELFQSLSDEGVLKLINRAIELHGADLVDDHIKSASEGSVNLAACHARLAETERTVLGKASKTKSGWFKTVTLMEGVACDIVGPDLENADGGFRELVDEIFVWASSG
jgi:putative ATP-dependent endonuclease of OLD family